MAPLGEINTCIGLCLPNIGPEDLLAPNPQLEFSLEKEFRFHRNLLQLSGDALLGLKLGQAYPLQGYGLFGYAFLSAPTLRQALILAANYGPLSFTLFKIDFQTHSGKKLPDNHNYRARIL